LKKLTKSETSSSNAAKRQKGDSDYPVHARYIVNLFRILNRVNYIFMIEVQVKIQQDEASISERFLQYDPFWLSSDDPIVKKMIEQVKSKFKSELKDPDIVVKIKMTV
jgi:hypothetical protein